MTQLVKFLRIELECLVAAIALWIEELGRPLYAGQQLPDQIDLAFSAHTEARHHLEFFRQYAPLGKVEGINNERSGAQGLPPRRGF